MFFHIPFVYFSSSFTLKKGKLVLVVFWGLYMVMRLVRYYISPHKVDYAWKTEGQRGWVSFFMSHSTLGESWISKTPGHCRYSVRHWARNCGIKDESGSPDNPWAKVWRVSTLAYSTTSYNTYFPKPSSFTHLPFLWALMASEFVTLGPVSEADK